MITADVPSSTIGNPRRRWRNLLLAPAFQWKYTGLFMLIVFVISTLTTVLIFSVLLRQVENRALQMVQNAEATTTSSITVTLVLCAVAFPTLAAGAVGLWSVLITHRMAGPLYSMARTLNELERGGVPMVRPLRRKDEFKDFHVEFRRAVDALRARRHEERDRLLEIEACARSAIEQPHDDPEPLLMSLLAQVQTLRRETEEALGVSEPAPQSDAPQISTPVRDLTPAAP